MRGVLPALHAGIPGLGAGTATDQPEPRAAAATRRADAADLAAGAVAAGCILGIGGLCVGVVSAADSASQLLALALPVAAAVAAAAALATRRLVGRQIAAAAVAQANGRVSDLQYAFDCLPEGVAVWNDDGQLLAANRQYRDVMPRIAAAITCGEDFEELVEVELDGGYGPDQAIHRWRERRLMQKLGDERSLIRRVDGRAYRVSEHQMGAGRSITVNNDVSETLTRERALRDREERFTLAQLAASEGLWDLDLRNRNFYVAPNVVAFVGQISTKGFRPRDWLRRIHRDDLPAYRRQLRAHLRGEQPVFAVTYRVDDGSGGERWIADRAVALRDSTGRAYRIAGTVTDVSEQKAAERALQAALARAEEAGEAKAKFLASISHELRTPLNAIIGFSQLLRELSSTSERHRAYVSNVLQAGARLTRTVNDLLDIAAAESGRLDLAEDHVDLARCLEDALAGLGAQADDVRNALSTRLPPNLPPICADGPRITQAMQHVLAITAEAAPACASLLLEGRWSPTSGIVLELSAGAAGLDRERLERALNLIGTGDSPGTVAPGGVDLGLVLASMLMVRHDGCVALADRNGHAAIQLRFPASRLA